MTALDTQPPVHIVTDLFTALAESSVRPTSFEIYITAPANMRCIDFTPAQLDSVTTVLARSKDSRFTVHSWARRNSLAENNDRPKEELAGLCALTRAFFSPPSLEHMQLRLCDYPCFYETPTISMSDLLPVPLPSTNISDLTFQSVPLKLAELRVLVDTMKDRLKSVGWSKPYLLEGDWADALGMLRDLSNLERVDFSYPYGGEYDSHGKGPDVEQKDFGAYILGEVTENPLQRWKTTRCE